jgi:uncharacterized damage-inducible protein DinB
MIALTVDELFEYTQWERGKWRECLQQHGEQVLDLTAGPHGDGRFETVRDLLKHVFAAEKRYVERLIGRPLTDHACIPSSSVEELFQFGSQSRKELEELVAAFPAREWDSPRDFKILDFLVNATPRKIVIHTLMHEIRHWAQIGTLLRLNGIVGEFHDFLASPVMGGSFSKEVARGTP